MIKIKTALISVYSKEGLDPILELLNKLNVTIYSTGGTQKYIEERGISVNAVEDLTSYPSILDGRVKTLHPKIFGGILAKREVNHMTELQDYNIPSFDLVIVDLYPFEETVANTDNENEIIEKIDIGGISLIRAAAKNFNDVMVVPSKNHYNNLINLLEGQQGFTTKDDRKRMALAAFEISSHYDKAIRNYFIGHDTSELRYGENPHQTASFTPQGSEIFTKLSGKELSYNNYIDIEAAISIMYEFKDDDPTFCVIKHTNSCGIATRHTIFDAWISALECDNKSAFGGILISNRPINLETAMEINNIFYEVLMAPSFDDDALELLMKKKKRVLLKVESWRQRTSTTKSLLNGTITQSEDIYMEKKKDLKTVTTAKPTIDQVEDLIFANKCVKHLKSNAIALVKNKQLIGMGCGQTSRIDAIEQAIRKAKAFGFDPKGAVLASDAFFPFDDSVTLSYENEIAAVIQPGGSIKDQDSIDFCDSKNMPMVFTGRRHFKH